MTAGQQRLHDLLVAWSPSAASSIARGVALAPLLQVVGPVRADTTQISVDTHDPAHLRITASPFDGRAFSGVRPDELSRLFRALESAALEERVRRLYRLGYALPDRLWVGIAPTTPGCVVKAYVATFEPMHQPWLPQLARDAGWLPPRMAPAFLSLYERLVPALANVEGVGVSYRDGTWLGTTLYLRSRLAWSAFASDAVATLVGIAPEHTLAGLADAFPEAPPAFGWSLECNPDGELVDLKTEMRVPQSCSCARITDYAEKLGVDPGVLNELSATIARAALSRDARPAPSVLSLRFIDGGLRSMVMYFPVEEPFASS